MASKKRAEQSALEWIVKLIGVSGVASHACCGEEDVAALLKDGGAQLQGGKRERILTFAERQRALDAQHPANILLALRHLHALPATTVAQESDLRASVINRLEGGHQIPTLETLTKVWLFWRARYHQIHLEDLCVANAFELIQRVERWRAEQRAAQEEAA